MVWPGDEVGSVVRTPPCGTRAEKFSCNGFNRCQFLTGAQPGLAESSWATRGPEEGARRAAISVMLVNSDGWRTFAFAGKSAFKLAAGLRRNVCALTNSQGAIGFSACHKPRRSLRAACSDC